MSSLLLPALLLCCAAVTSGHRPLVNEHFKAAFVEEEKTETARLSLTVATFNVLSQMKFVQGPTGFPLMTEDAFNAHQPGLTDDDLRNKFTQSSATNTWIQKILKELMVEAEGPKIKLMALQEIDFPMYEGIQQFIEANEDFALQALQQNSLTEATKTHAEFREKYTGKKIPSFKVKDFPYVIYNTKTVTSMTCTPVGTEGGLCDFQLDGSSATYKGLFMHASSVGVSGSLTLGMITENAELDLAMGDLNAHEDAVVKASSGLTLLPIKQNQANKAEFGTVLRHVYKLRKLAQCAQNTQNFKEARSKAGEGKNLTCETFKAICCGDNNNDKRGWYLGKDDFICDNEKLTKALKSDCKYGSKLCSAYQTSPEGEPASVSPKEAKEILKSGMFTDDQLDQVKKGTFDMGVLSGALGYGKDDWEMKTPKFRAADMDKFTQFQHTQEDYILVNPKHATALTARARVYKLSKVLNEKKELEGMARGLPGKTLPSDHLPLIADLTLEVA